jgi:hypothetical protein
MAQDHESRWRFGPRARPRPAHNINIVPIFLNELGYAAEIWGRAMAKTTPS